jgi:hypothetical protein
MLYSYQLSLARVGIIFFVACIGSVLDVLLIAAGVLAFEGQMLQFSGFPLWMFTLWVAFLTTFESSLSWLKGKPVLSAVFGFVGGPLSYYTASRLGAVEIGAPFFSSLFLIGFGWMVITPVVFQVYFALLSYLPRWEAEHAL